MVKVDRTFPPPVSLAIEEKKKNGSYSLPDVVAQLKSDFHNKCYLCELGNLQDPQIEHLLPHKDGQYTERKFDWNNLFWVCGHCNNVKNQKKYDEGILDCCKVDPELRIRFQYQNNDVNIIPYDKEDVLAIRTASLVQEIFSICNTGMRIYKSAMRLQELTREMNLLFDNLEEVKKHPESKIVHRKLKALLRRESAFAAFKRNYVREHLSQYPELQSYIL